MQYVWAPSSDFGVDRLSTLGNALLSTTADKTGLKNGTTYRVAKISWFAAFSATGITTPKADIPGSSDNQFIVAPAGDFDGAGNLIALTNALLANSLVLTGLSAGSWRVGVLTIPSGDDLVRGEADAFGDADWSASDYVSDGGDQIQVGIARLPSAGGYTALDVELQVGADDGAGGILWGAVQNIGLTGRLVTVLADTAAASRIRLVTDYENDNPWSGVKWAMPKRPAVSPTTTISFAGETLVVQGSQRVVQHKTGPVAIVVDPGATVTVQSKSPATSGTGSALRNGVMKNPQRYSNAIDGRAANRDETDLVSFPVTLQPNDILLSGTSAAEGTSNRNGPIDTYDMIYVTTTAPDPDLVAPGAVGWSGRNALATPTRVDYAAKASALPRAFGVAGGTYKTDLTRIRRELRFNPGMSFSQQTYLGYEDMTPYSWLDWGHAFSLVNYNYGQWLGERMSDWALHLVAPIEQVAVEVKAEILRYLDSFAWQIISSYGGFNSLVGGDGAHQLYWQFAVAIHYWLRDDFASLAAMFSIPPGGGNWASDFFYITQEMIDGGYFQPYGDPNSSLTSTTDFQVQIGGRCRSSMGHRRFVTAVDPVNLTVSFLSRQGGPSKVYGDRTKVDCGGAVLIDETTGQQALITTHVSGDIKNPGETIKVKLSAWPSSGISVGDVVAMVPEFTPYAGMPDWKERSWGEAPNGYYFTAAADYRNQQQFSGQLIALRAMGIWQPDWVVMWDYFLACNQSAWPSAVNNYDNMHGGSLAAPLWSAMKADILAVPQPYLGGVSVSPFYPAVPPVDLTAAGGSIMFPEGNNNDSAAILTTQKGALYQPDTGINFVASTTPQASFAIVAMPKDKRYEAGVYNGGNAALGIYGTGGSGGNRWWMRYDPVKYGVVNSRKRFEAYQFGNGGAAINQLSAEWTEDMALIVHWCDGANNWQLDWLSLLDGTRYQGAPKAASVAATSSMTGSQFGVGRATTGNAFAANGGNPYFFGEVEALGTVRGAAAIDFSKWATIALGADIAAELGMANLRWWRRLDGTPSSYGPVAGAINDATTAALVPVIGATDIPAANLQVGSHLRRQSLLSYLTIDRISDEWPYGLFIGETTRMVPFSGKAAGYTGGVQIRVYDAATGEVVRDWTTVATIAGGAWSGQLELPKGRGWWYCDVRLVLNPGVVVTRRQKFSVGYKFMAAGQSQLSICLGSSAGSTATDQLDYPMSGSYLTDNLLESVSPGYLSMAGIGMLYNNAGLIYFLNQFRKFDPSTPIMLIDEAVNGTSMFELIDADTDNSRISPDSRDRTMSNLRAKLAAYGNDIAILFHEWGTNDMSESKATFDNLLSALFFGTGPAAGVNNLTAELGTKTKFVLMPLTRHTGGASYVANANTARSKGVSWANANGVAVAPPASDYKILAIDAKGNPTGGPHSSGSGLMAGPHVMARLAVGAARVLGLDTSQNPSFNTATLSADRTTITITFNLPNGGALFSPAPNALRSFQVDNGNTGSWSSTGFTAAIVGNTVMLTNTAGAWLAGTRCRYLSNLENRADGDQAAEDAIIAGALYETWAPDVCGLGLPIIGAMSGGKWVPDWTVVCIQG